MSSTETAEYFRKLANEATHWHVTTDTDLANRAADAIEALAMYEEGHVCEECGYIDKAIEESICYDCSPEGKEEYARARAEDHAEARNDLD